jgi:type III secretory pathway component EscV
MSSWIDLDNLSLDDLRSNMNKLILSLLATVVVVSGCVGSSSTQPESSPTQDTAQAQPSQSPSEVVKSYLNNFDEGNIDQAYSLLSEQIKAEERTEVLEQKRSMQRIDDTRGSDFSIEVPTTEVVNESDTASTLRVEIDLYTLDRYTDTINRTVSLVKEDGEWRLSEVPKPYDRDGNNLGLGQ